MKDDKRRLNGKRTWTTVLHSNMNSDSESPQRTKVDDLQAKINLLRDEIDWLSNLPISSLSASFVFLNNPSLNGAFIMPSLHDIIHPNHGLYALQHDYSSNKAFLHVEHRYCRMISTIRLMERRDDHPFPAGLKDIKQTIYDDLSRLNREKAFQWAQQRVPSTEGYAILVNTGEYTLV